LDYLCAVSLGEGIKAGELDVASVDEEPQADVRRFAATSIVVLLGTSIPFLWVAWDEWTGRIDPLRSIAGAPNTIYDVQARAIMHGHFWIPPGSIKYDAFVAHGHQYTYFGIFPSLLRIPVLLFTSSLDGRLSELSITGAWIVTALFCSLLLWRLRIFLRGNAALGWLEASTYGLLLVAILIGSVLVFLASRPDTPTEDEAWSVALFCGTLFALVGVIERPSWRRVALCGSLVLLTDLNRATTGYAAVLATLLVALWFALGREGQPLRHWALPIAGAALVPMAIGCAINMVKFGLLFGAPFSSQVLFQIQGLQKINGGHYFSLHWLPSTLSDYVDPANFSFSSVFPYLNLPSQSSGLFGGQPTAGIPLSMPLLFVAGLIGVTTTFMPGQGKPFRALRLLLIASAAPAAAILLFGWIFEQYVADFVPLLVFAAMIGLVDVWRRLASRPRSTTRLVPVVAGALTLWSVWANLGFSVAPGIYESSTQVANYIKIQRAFSDVTGHPLDHKVIVSSQIPNPAPVGTLFVKGRCQALYLAWAAVPKSSFAGLAYLPVERAPDTPICDSLIERSSTTKR